jgi:hypothetical protein
MKQSYVRRHLRGDAVLSNTTAPRLQLVPTPSEKNPDHLLNSREVAEMLGVDVSWVKNHTTRTEPFLPYVRLGAGRYAMRRFRREQILQFIEQHTYTPRKMA